MNAVVLSALVVCAPGKICVKTRPLPTCKLEGSRVTVDQMPCRYKSQVITYGPIIEVGRFEGLCRACQNIAAPMFRDWFNNFLTVERFAEHYGISVSRAEQVLSLIHI